MDKTSERGHISNSDEIKRFDRLSRRMRCPSKLLRRDEGFVYSVLISGDEKYFEVSENGYASLVLYLCGKISNVKEREELLKFAYWVMFGALKRNLIDAVLATQEPIFPIKAY